jgi:hypothetical protein
MVPLLVPLCTLLLCASVRSGALYAELLISSCAMLKTTLYVRLLDKACAPVIADCLWLLILLFRIGRFVAVHRDQEEVIYHRIDFNSRRHAYADLILIIETGLHILRFTFYITIDFSSIHERNNTSADQISLQFSHPLI